MIAGVINDSFEPIVEIGLLRAGQTTTIPAVVDTGFSGYVCLSRYRIEAMDLEFSYVDRYELADGTVVAKDVCGGPRLSVLNRQAIWRLLKFEALI